MSDSFHQDQAKQGFPTETEIAGALDHFRQVASGIPKVAIEASITDIFNTPENSTTTTTPQIESSTTTTVIPESSTTTTSAPGMDHMRTTTTTELLGMNPPTNYDLPRAD